MSLNVLQYHFFSLRALLQQKHHFCLFQLVSPVNLLWYQIRNFYCPLRKKRSTLLPEETHIHIWQHICLSLYYYAQVINLKNMIVRITLPLVFLVKTFDKVIVQLRKTQATNSTVLWCLQSDQVALGHNFRCDCQYFFHIWCVNR